MAAEGYVCFKTLIVQTNVKQLLVHTEKGQLQNITAAHMAVKFVVEYP